MPPSFFTIFFSTVGVPHDARQVKERIVNNVFFISAALAVATRFADYASFREF